ncbi:hypothetical protein GP486_000527 [Trichoglossum hirsutum]|uniref:Uncharacterized protein n=1 Tax=Trichoglossum hirsutum TaxID=265104 RepID=A0A9P8LID2_9PEZI|nr:hypothetical protein GP486_000527 [Trichoglossum hirsutum]
MDQAGDPQPSLVAVDAEVGARFEIPLQRTTCCRQQERYGTRARVQQRHLCLLQAPAPQHTDNTTAKNARELGIVQSRTSNGPRTALHSDYVPDSAPILSESEPHLSIDDLPKSYFGARLINATFGMCGSKPACLLVIQADFMITISNSHYRFQEATIEADFQDGVSPTFSAPEVVHLAPTIKEYKITSLRAAYRGLGVTPGIAPHGGPIQAYYGTTNAATREGQKTIHGMRRGYPATGALWSITEDADSRSGIPRVCKVGVILTYAENRRFTMTVEVKATAKGGLPVKGSTKPIMFDPALYEIPFGLELEESNLVQLCSNSA